MSMPNCASDCQGLRVDSIDAEVEGVEEHCSEKEPSPHPKSAMGADNRPCVGAAARTPALARRNADLVSYTRIKRPLGIPVKRRQALRSGHAQAGTASNSASSRPPVARATAARDVTRPTSRILPQVIRPDRPAGQDLHDR